MIKSFLTLLLTLLLTGFAFAGEVIPDGTGTYGVEIDVLFTFEPEDLDRWESVFNIASARIWQGTSGEVYLKKVNFIVCPFEIEGGQSSATADVVIRYPSGPTQVSFSPGTLSGSRPGGVVFYVDGKGVETDGRVMAHELFHYMFEIFDEYKKPKQLDQLEVEYPFAALKITDPSNIRAFFNSLAAEGVITVTTEEEETERFQALLDDYVLKQLTSTKMESEDNITRLNFRQFCSRPIDQNDPDLHSCVMDAGLEREVGRAATGAYYRFVCDTDDHCSGVATIDNKGQKVLWSKNAHANRAGRSCASVAKDVWIKYHKGFLHLTGTLVSGNGPETKFDKKDTCDETVVLLLDKSGSMEGARIASLKRAAIGLIDSLDDDTKLGIVWFDSQPRAAVGIQELKDSRELAKQAISSVDAGGGTNIGFGLGVAYEQLVLLRNPDEDRPEEIIFLITDGISSDDPTSVVNVIRNDGVKINPVSIGTDTDFSFLQSMASQTSGTFYFSADDEDIARVVTQGATENLEGYSLIDEFTIDPLTSPVEIELDRFVGNLLVQLELNDFDTTGLSNSNFELIGPNGSKVAATVRFTAFDENSALVTFELATPEGGEYKVNLPAGGLRATSTARSLLLAQSNSLRMFAGLNPGGMVQYPEPVVIKAGVESELGSAQDLSVVANVRQPDGNIVTVRLRDDGNPSDGDELADDGVYSASFSRYSGDGPYSVEVIADNSSDQAIAGNGMHGTTGEVKIGPFVRRKTLNFEIENFAAPVGNTLTLSKAKADTSLQLFSSGSSPQSSVVLANFHVQTGDGQGVVVQQLDLSFTTDTVDLSGFKAFDIYVDSDEDGLIDFVGDYSRPIGRVTPTIENGLVSLQDVVTLPANSDFDILVVGTYQAEVSIHKDDIGILTAGIPLIGLLLSGLMVSLSRRRRTLIVGAVLAATSVAILGCGSGNDFVLTGSAPVNPESAAPNVVTHVGEVRSQLDLTSVRAAGLIDGLPVTVTLPTEPLVQGPPITVETQTIEL